MALVDDLAAGTHGLVAVPAGLTVHEQSESSATFVDPQPGLRWWWFFFPDLHLALEPFDFLQFDAQRHTRQLFDAMFEPGANGLDLAGETRPRTSDPSWTPLIELEPTQIAGGTALTVLHRMHYQPGRETIMGHTLVPTEAGLFEARWLSVARETGYRESALMLMRGALNEGAPAFQPQSVYDDPQYDATFPQHPLSIARAAKLWHASTRLEVTRRPRMRAFGREDMLDPIGCAIVAPPRFLREGMSTDGDDVSCVLARVAFCGTDGVDRLVVTRSGERFRGLAVTRRLASFARERSLRTAQRRGLASATCEVSPIDGSRPAISVVTEGDASAAASGRARTVARWFLGASGRAWAISIVSTVAVPVDELTRDVTYVAQSWRQ